MATMGAGRGGNRGFDARGGFGYRNGFDTRSGFTARKSRNDDKAGGSDLHPPVPDRQREAEQCYIYERVNERLRN